MELGAERDLEKSVDDLRVSEGLGLRGATRRNGAVHVRVLRLHGRREYANEQTCRHRNVAAYGRRYFRATLPPHCGYGAGLVGLNPDGLLDRLETALGA
jgi:hypothetical protein